MSMIDVDEGMFAYGVTPKSKREGMIGWISKINYKKKVAISYRDGRTATWNVNNIVVAHDEEAYEDVSCTFSTSRGMHGVLTVIAVCTATGTWTRSLVHAPFR